MTIREMQKRAHDTARAKGWWEDCQTPEGDVDPVVAAQGIPEKLCLIHSEVSEALESYRKAEPLMWFTDAGKPEGVAAELADVLIRIGDLCGALGIDVQSAVEAKMAYNDQRAHRHGGKRC